MGVTFEEEKFQSNVSYNRKLTGVSGLFVKLGIAKDEKQAKIVMVGLIVALVVISLIAINSSGTDNDITLEHDPSMEATLDPVTALPYDKQ